MPRLVRPRTDDTRSRTADWESAVPQVGNLRYGRLPVCGTPGAEAGEGAKPESPPRMNGAGSMYGILVLAGVGVSVFLWTRLARADARLPAVYFSGLCGAFIGAKVAYLLAEGWLRFGEPGMWLDWATGKSILGALLGGYAGVELGKRHVGFAAATGDRFALIAPIGIVIGRVGCLVHGCCPGRVCAPAWYASPDAGGVHRWPAVPVEMAFNLAFLTLVGLVLRPRRLLPGQHFHLYLIAYGLFRLVHETARDTPRIVGPVSGYQLLAVMMVGFGILRWAQRQQSFTPAA